MILNVKLAAGLCPVRRVPATLLVLFPSVAARLSGPQDPALSWRNRASDLWGQTAHGEYGSIGNKCHLLRRGRMSNFTDSRAETGALELSFQS